MSGKGTRIKHWNFRGIVDGMVRTEMVDEYGHTFLLDMDLTQAEILVDGITEQIRRYRKKLALTSRPTIETEVAIVMDRIQREERVRRLE